jgi:hypothetical protein
MYDDDNNERPHRPMPFDRLNKIFAMIEEAVNRKDFDDELLSILQRHNITLPVDHGT